jgi:hypothetical protein
MLWTAAASRTVHTTTRTRPTSWQKARDPQPVFDYLADTRIICHNAVRGVVRYRPVPNPTPDDSLTGNARTSDPRFTLGLLNNC